MVGALSDKADGIIARRYNSETRLGVILEGIADGMLIFSGLMYIYFKLDFPTAVLIIFVIIFVLGFAGNLINYIFRRKWHMVRHIIFKFVGLVAHLLIIIYLFNIPYKLYFAWIAVIIGVIFLFDYFRRLVLFNKEAKK